MVMNMKKLKINKTKNMMKARKNGKSVKNEEEDPSDKINKKKT